MLVRCHLMLDEYVEGLDLAGEAITRAAARILLDTSNPADALVEVMAAVELAEESDDPTVVLARADERLYAAKRAGRDRVHGPAGRADAPEQAPARG